MKSSLLAGPNYCIRVDTETHCSTDPSGLDGLDDDAGDAADPDWRAILNIGPAERGLRTLTYRVLRAPTTPFAGGNRSALDATRREDE